MFQNIPTFMQASRGDKDDPNEIENKEQNELLNHSTTNVPIYILSPSVNIIWLYLLDSFRNQIDFDFQRPADWSNDSQVLKFNHTKYVSMHNIFDWHNFAILNDNTFLYPSLLVQRAPAVLWYIREIKYELSDTLLNIDNNTDFTLAKTKQFWQCDANMYYQEVVLRNDDNQWHVSANIYIHKLQPADRLPIINFETITQTFVDSHNNDWSPNKQTQHPDVAAGKPFFFSILGFDAYHHTTFTGKHDWDTHGVYWWFGNINPKCQFNNQMTMIMSHVPDNVPFNIVASICYRHWIHIMSAGIPLWHDNEMITSYGMVSHQITDMEDRDPLLHRRGNNKFSSCDGATWLGYRDGIKWPDNVNNMMQLNIITPGYYLGKLKTHVYNECVNRQIWEQFPDDYGKLLTLSKHKEDIYNGVPLASSLKSTIELNHTTLLGVLPKLFQILWHNMHRRGMLTKIHSRYIMKAYLHKYFQNINGMMAKFVDFKTKPTVFNQMHHAWQYMIEVCICLPCCMNWYYHLDILVALTRITGLLFSIKTENQRLRAQNILQPILQQSSVCL